MMQLLLQTASPKNEQGCVGGQRLSRDHGKLLPVVERYELFDQQVGSHYRKRGEHWAGEHLEIVKQ
jgi:hypothetical protein